MNKKDAPHSSNEAPYDSLVNALYNNPFYSEYYQPPVLMDKEHWHNHIEFNFLKRGEMEYLFGGKRLLIPEKKLVFFWSGIPHRTLKIFESADGQAPVLFNVYIPLESFLLWEGLRKIYNSVLDGEILLIDAPDKHIDNLTEIWTEDIQKRRDGAMTAVNLEIRALLNRYPVSALRENASALHNHKLETADIRKKWERMGSPNKHRILAKTLKYIIMHLQEKISHAQIAEYVGCHETYLRRIFREMLGSGIHPFVMNLRLKYACTLLRETDKSITEIADETGFGSLSRFYKAFETNLSNTPSAYRKCMMER